MNAGDVQMTDNISCWTQILSYHQPDTTKYLLNVILWTCGISGSLGTILFFYYLKIHSEFGPSQFYQKQNVQMSDKVSIYYPSLARLSTPLSSRFVLNGIENRE